MVTTITEIKAEMADKVGERITVIAQTGRKKQVKRYGILSELYPAVFIVHLDQDEHSFERTSYSYTDVLTNTVAISFNDIDAEVRESEAH